MERTAECRHKACTEQEKERENCKQGYSVDGYASTSSSSGIHHPSVPPLLITRPSQPPTHSTPK
jgi:hypothetical protein